MLYFWYEKSQNNYCSKITLKTSLFMSENLPKIDLAEILNSRNFPFFSKEEKKEFDIEKQIVKIKKGDEIISEGVVPEGIYCVYKGTAKLFVQGFSGKEQILHFLKPGDITGYRSLLCHEPFGATAIAMEDMEISFISKKFFLKISRHSSAIFEN